MCKSLKLGEAQGPDSLIAEHLLHSHPIIYLHCCNLFKSLVIHGFVPDDFGNKVIIPLIKDKSLPVGSLSNYRAITLIPVISNVFEGVLLNIANHLFISDDLQFGLKKNSGCANALYTFRSTVDYFNANGSSMYVAAFDISRAFDVINHFKLFFCLDKYWYSMVYLDYPQPPPYNRTKVPSQAYKFQTSQQTSFLRSSVSFLSTCFHQAQVCRSIISQLLSPLMELSTNKTKIVCS